MSQINGLKYLVTREGQDGKRGRIHAVIQVVENSPIIDDLLVPGSRWYLGSKEEYQAHSKSLAGDLDGDGDFDEVDKQLIKLLNDAAE